MPKKRPVVKAGARCSQNRTFLGFGVMGVNTKPYPLQTKEHAVLRSLYRPQACTNYGASSSLSKGPRCYFHIQQASEETVSLGSTFLAFMCVGGAMDYSLFGSSFESH